MNCAECGDNNWDFECATCRDKAAPVSNSRLIDGLAVVGLKDHEIQELVNLLTAKLRPLTKAQCLREMIHNELVPYLESRGLRIDR
jgi:hypothetical protein